MASSFPVTIASNQSNLVVVGILTNNNAAPTTTNFGVLPALCNTAAPTFTNGNQTLLSVDTSGNLRVAGAGTAGSPSGGVVSIQGVASGTAVPVSGTVTANLGTQTSTGGTNYSVSVGTSSSQLTSQTCNIGVQLEADRGNSGSVYVGFTSGVTAGGTPSTNGLKLVAGAGLFIPVANANQIWLMGHSEPINLCFDTIIGEYDRN